MGVLTKYSKKCMPSPGTPQATRISPLPCCCHHLQFLCSFCNKCAVFLLCVYTFIMINHFLSPFVCMQTVINRPPVPNADVAAASHKQLRPLLYVRRCCKSAPMEDQAQESSINMVEREGYCDVYIQCTRSSPKENNRCNV